MHKEKLCDYHLNEHDDNHTVSPQGERDATYCCSQKAYTKG